MQECVSGDKLCNKYNYQFVSGNHYDVMGCNLTPSSNQFQIEMKTFLGFLSINLQFKKNSQFFAIFFS